MEIAVDRDRDGLPCSGGRRAPRAIRAALSLSHMPSSPTIDERAASRSASAVRRASTTACSSAAIGRRRQHVRRGRERDVETGGDLAECGGRLDRVGGADRRAIARGARRTSPSRLGLRGGTVGDRDEGRHAVGMLPRSVPERRRHLVEAGRQEMSREHAGPLVAGRRSTRIASRRPCHPRRSTRSTGPPRSVALPPKARWGRAAGRRTSPTHPPSRSGRAAPRRRRLRLRPGGSSSRPRQPPTPASRSTASSKRSQRPRPRSSASSKPTSERFLPAYRPAGRQELGRIRRSHPALDVSCGSGRHVAECRSPRQQDLPPFPYGN